MVLSKITKNTYDNAYAAGGFASSSRSQFLYLWLSVVRKKILTSHVAPVLVSLGTISLFVSHDVANEFWFFSTINNEHLVSRCSSFLPVIFSLIRITDRRATLSTYDFFQVVSSSLTMFAGDAYYCDLLLYTLVHQLRNTLHLTYAPGTGRSSHHTWHSRCPTNINITRRSMNSRKIRDLDHGFNVFNFRCWG